VLVFEFYFLCRASPILPTPWLVLTYGATNLSFGLLLFLHPKCFSFLPSGRNFVPYCKYMKICCVHLLFICELLNSMHFVEFFFYLRHFSELMYAAQGVQSPLWFTCILSCSTGCTIWTNNLVFFLQKLSFKIFCFPLCLLKTQIAPLRLAAAKASGYL